MSSSPSPPTPPSVSSGGEYRWRHAWPGGQYGPMCPDTVLGLSTSSCELQCSSSSHSIVHSLAGPSTAASPWSPRMAGSFLPKCCQSWRGRHWSHSQLPPSHLRIITTVSPYRALSLAATVQDGQQQVGQCVSPCHSSGHHCRGGLHAPQM